VPVRASAEKKRGRRDVVRPVNGAAPPGCRDYWEQLDETVVTDDTRTRWADIDEDVPLVAEVLDVPELVPDESRLDSVPVISTFSPTCLVSSLSWPSRT